MQLITQDEASSQWIGWVHELAPQLITHGTSGGQSIWNAHCTVSHSNTQLLFMHVPPAVVQLSPHTAGGASPVVSDGFVSAGESAVASIGCCELGGE